jgi:hypothetical protein
MSKAADGLSFGEFSGSRGNIFQITSVTPTVLSPSPFLPEYRRRYDSVEHRE